MLDGWAPKKGYNNQMNGSKSGVKVPRKTGPAYGGKGRVSGGAKVGG